MTLEIYFSDLTHEAQERYLEFFGISNAAENNADILPIFELHDGDLRDES